MDLLDLLSKLNIPIKVLSFSGDSLLVKHKICSQEQLQALSLLNSDFTEVNYIYVHVWLKCFTLCWMLFDTLWLCIWICICRSGISLVTSVLVFQSNFNTILNFIYNIKPFNLPKSDWQLGIWCTYLYL